MKSIKKFWQESKFPILAFLVWRIFLFFVSFVSASFLPLQKSFPYADTLLVPSGLPAWVYSWGGFDGVHYLTIAKSGYDGFGTQVFFPLYPGLINLLSRIIINPIMSGLLISNLAILLAGVFLYQMINKQKGRNVAIWTIIFLYAFPASFFFGAIYTESLFLLLVVLTFSRSKIFGFLAGMTRLIGVFLFPWGWAGLAVYSFYLWWRFDQPLFFLSAQSAFGNSRASSLASLVFPPQVVYRYLRMLLTVSPWQYDYWVVVSELAAFCFGVVILTWVTVKRKLPVSWLVFGWLVLFLPTVSGTLSSMPRYLLAIFPIFVALGLINNRFIKLAILIIFAVLLAISSILFTRGYWVS